MKPFQQYRTLLLRGIAVIGLLCLALMCDEAKNKEEITEVLYRLNKSDSLESAEVTAVNPCQNTRCPMEVLDIPSDQEIPASHLIEAPYISQSGEYPTGCEIVSAAMLLQYWGFDYDVDRLIDDFLSMSSLEWENGELVGDRPDQSFIGNPRTENSYGCYAPVIEEVLVQAVDDAYCVQNLAGTDIDVLWQAYLSRDFPVIVWESIYMVPTYEGSTWRVRGTDEYFTWTAEEHCMLLVGYDEDCYYLHDPYDGNGLVRYPRETVEARYEELGKQALALVPFDE